MTKKRKGLLVAILVVVVATHVGLFAAGGSWRTMGIVLVAVDVVSGLFIFGAIREFRKLDEEKDSE